MKRLAATTALILTAPLAQASDFAATFAISGNLTFGGKDYNVLEMDLNIGDRYIAANGGLIGVNGLTSPATGTCFTTSAGGLFCNLQIDQTSVMVDITANLSGAISYKDANGFLADSASIQLLSLN